MQLAKAIRNVFVVIADVVDGDRQQERPAGGHQVRAIDGEFPFKPEVTLLALMRVAGNDRNEKRTVLDLPSDGGIPGIAAAQRALVEPHLDAGGP